MRLEGEEGGAANIALGFFNVLQWSVASLVPIIQVWLSSLVYICTCRAIVYTLMSLLIAQT